jgi:hypothetical protein
MAAWVIWSQSQRLEHRQLIDIVSALHGPVVDAERVFTDLDLREGAFRALTDAQRDKLTGSFRSCLSDYLKSVSRLRNKASRYEVFANRIEIGDVIVTFNYDVSLENELIRAQKFRVRNGYGFKATWNERDSDVKVLKPHGSINWIGLIDGGARAAREGDERFSFSTGQADFSNHYGPHPFVDNLDSVFPDYPGCILDNDFPGGGVTPSSTTLVLPTYQKKYSVKTSIGPQWASFYDNLWSQAAEALQQADRIFLLGYSMPEADRRSRALLWSSNKQAEVLLCCATSNETLKLSFETHGFWNVHEKGSFETAFI